MGPSEIKAVRFGFGCGFGDGLVGLTCENRAGGLLGGLVVLGLGIRLCGRGFGR